MENKIKIIIFSILAIVVGIIVLIVVSNKSVPVTEITLEPKNITIYVGDKTEINTTIFPKNATDKTIIWESSNKNVAVVDDTGTVIGLRKGKASIIVSTIDNSVKESCHVTVKDIEVKEISLSDSSVTLKKGESKQIIATVYPQNAVYDYLLYQSMDKNIVSVSDNGIITANNPGETEIIVSEQISGVEARCKVLVEPEELNKIELDKKTINMNVGEEEMLRTILTPSDVTDVTISWKSSDSNVVAVDMNGKIQAVSKGEAVITATSNNGKKATCVIKKKKKIVSVTSLTLNKKNLTLTVGKSEKLVAVIKPSNATNKKITWSSGNAKVATVDSNGNVKAKSVGTAVILAKTNDGSKGVTCTVKVKKAALPAIVPQSPFVQYESATLRYYIQGYNKNDYYLTYIWMEDPYNQIKKMDPTIATYGKVYTDAEVDSQGLVKTKMNIGDQMAGLVANGFIPASKGAIGYNGGGFFDNSLWPPDDPYYDKRSSSWIVMNNGVLTRNRIAEDSAPIDTIIGITSGGNLKIYGSGARSAAQRQNIANAIKNDKVKNTWAFNPVLVGPEESLWYDTTRAQRNGICQINSNNYVMYTSGNNTTNYIEMSNIFKSIGCKVAFNLDGGGSTSLFYKVGNSTAINKVKCGANPCRPVIEGIYFTEQ